MNKVMLLMGLLLVAFNTFAGTCANGSLLGGYNYNLPNVHSGNGYHSVGRINFNGNGSFTLSGIAAQYGVATPTSGSGTYSVTAGCLATMTINLNQPVGVTATQWIYLDQMDNAPATRLAYHGNVIHINSTGWSASGTIDRVVGKFQ